MRGLRQSRNQGERGAIATLVAIFLGGGFLLGFLALVVDTGTLYFERRVQQGSAEAGALAVAQRCAENATDCSSTASAIPLAARFANFNSPDGFSAVDTVCGDTKTFSGGSFTNRLTPCTSPAQVNCKAVSASYPRYARVISQSAESATQKLIFPLTRKINGDSTGVALKACAQTAWGKAASAPIALPLALPLMSPLDPSNVTLDRKNYILKELVTRQGAYQCDPCDPISTIDGSFTATHLPKGFGFVNFFTNPDGTCKSGKVQVVPALVPRELNVEQICGGIARFNQYLGQSVYIPVIFDICDSSGNCTSPSGSGQWFFRIGAFFKFTVKGYYIVNTFNGIGPYSPAGSTTPRRSDWPADCGAGNACLFGDFGRGVIPNQKISLDPTIPNLGVQAMELLP